MKAPKCANCGEEMIETHTKSGIRLYVCQHVTIKQVNAISGKFHYGEIHCGLIIDGLKASFEKLMQKHKSTTTLEQLRKATRYTVSDSKLLENANLAAMLDIPCDEIPIIFEATYKLSLAMAISIDYGITSLCKGIARKRMVILDNIGVTFRTEDAYKWFASEHKLDKLNEAQKDQAWKLYAIKTIKEKATQL